MLHSRDFQEGDCVYVTFVGGLRMDALSGLKWIASCLFTQLFSYYLLFVDSIASYKSDLNLPIPVEPDTGNYWIFDTVIEVDTEVAL